MDVLKDIEIAYNNTPHRGLGFETPNNVHNLTDLRKIKQQEKIQLAQKFKNYGAISTLELRKKVSRTQALKRGAHVRLLLAKAEKVFQKSYEPLYTKEVFIIKSVKRKFPFTYYLKDLNGNSIEGLVYRQELKEVTLPKNIQLERFSKKK